MNRAITLSELSDRIKNAINQAFPNYFWIVAEISECNTNRNGHCYLELIQKDENTEKILAKTRATIWAYSYRIISAYFYSQTNENLRTGLKIMVKASVEYHEVYSFSLNITDIDPIYSLGDAAKKRMETIKKLQQEGVFEMNKELEIPKIPNKIAVISSGTAAGYGDFLNQLKNNEFSYSFSIKLFEAYMQGEETETSIIRALERIAEVDYLFDVVVIIRGGGSKSDLSWFDSYLLASNVAQFPLPIITGIGHERDESVVDLVANTKMKTPTAVAQFLISKMNEVDAYLSDLKTIFISATNKIMQVCRNKLDIASSKYNPLFTNIVNQQKQTLEFQYKRLYGGIRQNFLQKQTKLTYTSQNLKFIFSKIIRTENTKREQTVSQMNYFLGNIVKHQKQKIEHYERINRIQNPENILQKGYSILRKNGKIITSVKELQNGDKIENQLINGIIESEITNIN